MKSRLVLSFEGWLLIYQKGKGRSIAEGRRKHVWKEHGVTEGVCQLCSSPTEYQSRHVLHLKNHSRFTTTCLDTFSLLPPLLSYPQLDSVPHSHSKCSISDQWSSVQYPPALTWVLPSNLFSIFIALQLSKNASLLFQSWGQTHVGSHVRRSAAGFGEQAVRWLASWKRAGEKQ